MEHKKDGLLTKLSRVMEVQASRLRQWTQPKEFIQIQEFTMGDRRRMAMHYAIAQDLEKRKIFGDFVECGVYNGGSAAVFALGLKNTVEKIWLYDSFSGMPRPGEIDQREALNFVGECLGSEEKVRQAMAISGIPKGRYVIRRGLFKDTFLLELPQKISLLHIDCDWHESVLACLNTFYDRVVAGGVILLDDFGHWEGAREALFDFLESRHLRPVLERFGHSQLFWVKGRLHNRDFMGRESVLEK